MDIIKTINLRPGHYVVAVSGGVDSIALLHMLANKYGKKHKNVRFTVAHYDHGIRDSSHIDRALVNEVATEHGLPFVFEEGILGDSPSEAAAREARYKFLRTVQAHTGAHSIITAHHLDDMVETAILNIIRGTGRKGMSSLHKSKDGLVRPLLHVPKTHLKSYAEANGLTWHEDSTNLNQDFKRNYVRHSIIPKAKKTSPQDYHKLVAILRRQRDINYAIDTHLETILHTQVAKTKLRRRDVAALPYRVATELVAEWLRQNGKRQLSRWLVDRLTVSIRTASPNTDLLLDAHSKVSFSKISAEFIRV
ncbi:MAG: tRNA lysidine(34) synthetase TilS [bacterium]|nr:tRNA lysidine(34) synthetase TilS [bacterium]